MFLKLVVKDIQIVLKTYFRVFQGSLEVPLGVMIDQGDWEFRDTQLLLGCLCPKL